MNKKRNFIAAAIVLILLVLLGCGNDLVGGTDPGVVGKDTVGVTNPDDVTKPGSETNPSVGKDSVGGTNSGNETKPAGETKPGVETKPGAETNPAGETNPGAENETGVGKETNVGNETDSGTEINSASEIDLSKLLGWKWAQEPDGSGTYFTWIFYPDGTISTVHCCGLVFDASYNYFYKGNILVTYGSEMDAAKVEVASFTMADDGLSFTLSNGRKFTRDEAWPYPTSSYDYNQAFKLLRKELLGIWRGDGGMEFVFNSDNGLLINSEEYCYFVYGNQNIGKEFVAVGPFADGTPSVPQKKYRFTRTGNKLSLVSQDNKKYSLTLSE
jgi:hypothetical protein